MPFFQSADVHTQVNEHTGTAAAPSAEQAEAILPADQLPPPKAAPLPEPADGPQTPPASARPRLLQGNSLSLVLSCFAVGLALFAVGRGLLYNPLGSGASHYDFSSPRAALVSEMKVKLNKDLLAMIELGLMEERPQLQEKLKTLEVRKEVERDGVRYLFISFTEKGAKRQQVMPYKRSPQTGQWQLALFLNAGNGAGRAAFDEQVRAWENEGRLP
jgi:hypothetical protein